jgi:hypothetical protein
MSNDVKRRDSVARHWKVSVCGGFRPPEMMVYPRAETAGGRKAPRHEIACWKGRGGVHVLNHALAQRGDRLRTHGKLLSWTRLMATQSSRQDASSATAISTLILGEVDCLNGLSRSDLVFRRVPAFGGRKSECDPYRSSGAMVLDTLFRYHASV